jgi:hypothetical protein
VEFDKHLKPSAKIWPCLHFHSQNVWKKHKGHLSKLENLYSSSLKDLKAETMVQDVEELKGARKDGWNILLEYVRTFHILPCSPQKEFLTVFVYHSF